MRRAERRRKAAPPAPNRSTKAPKPESAVGAPEDALEDRHARRRARIQARKDARRELCKRRRVLQEHSRRLDLEVPPGASASNATCPYPTVEQERAARQQTCENQLEVVRRLWPKLWRRLRRIPDVRNPKTVEHRFAILMLYGVLLFVLQMSSRRDGNREMTRPQFLENLRLWFPEVEKLPHQDTVARVLAKTDPAEIEAALIELVGGLIRNKKFQRYLVARCYPICMDGTQKLKRNELVEGQWLTRTIRKADGTEEQHYVYVLEVSLAFRNGMTIPLLSEFLTYNGGEETKQDCEQRAFHRVVERLKKAFPRLPILVLVDGLYPNGPVMAACRKNRWQYMIVLPDTCLSSVWEEYRGLKPLGRANRLEMTWKGRRQVFTWVNDIAYRYGPNENRCQTTHVVVCEESWEDWDETAQKIVVKTARHAWISSEPLSKETVHERCNLGARHRWGIEEGILAEKHHGYRYEHCFSYDWNAMRGYHYLMRIGHLMNVLVWYSSALSKEVRHLGIRGLLRLVWSTLAGPWLDPESVKARARRRWQLRLL